MCACSFHDFQNTDFKYSLDLHIKYEAKKKELTDLAFVEENKKTDVQEKLEKKYVDQDVPVSFTGQFLVVYYRLNIRAGGSRAFSTTIIIIIS